MNEPVSRRFGDLPSRAGPYGQGSSANLADILERVLDKGIVIAGDIQINLLDIELLTIKLRLLVASVDKAKEMGIDWWEHDPALSSRASDGHSALAEENRRLRAEIEKLRRDTELPPTDESESVTDISESAADESESDVDEEPEGEADASEGGGGKSERGS
ncbi:gas vesicle protein [Streptomyces sp. Da 82-17]|uniref:gas vesicle protein n=1 Tax=Streptomyces sp. Da 82-17 TaxID=3377116 RepID=UPI0038D4C2DF